MSILRRIVASLVLIAGLSSPLPAAETPGAAVLRPENFKHYVDAFNEKDQELYAQYVPNSAAWEFLRENIPLFECPDKDVEEIYYFRWWTYRKHLKETPDGFVVTEFLPKVGWSGKHNTINCAAGHHFYEGRWLRDPKFLDDYAAFWFRKGGGPRRYSFWAADAMWARFMATGNAAIPKDLLPDLVKNYEAWEEAKLDPATGLFWQIDDRDGMEVSIGGSGFRATINSYMFGDATAIAKIADLAGQPDLAKSYREKAARVRQLVLEKLWDPEAKFFKVLPRGPGARLADVRELHGYTPWYFGLPDPSQAVAWREVMDPKGFYAPFGPTTAEQRHPRFAISYTGHECQWNGPSWPYSTAVTLTGLANLLNGPPQDAIGRRDYFDLLKIYTRSHRLKREDGTTVPWIDENLNPLTGDWISRTRLRTNLNGTWNPKKGGVERGKDYNHSTYCDLIIAGLVGLRPRADDVVEVNPLLPEGTWDYFCLDNIPYHGRTLTILYDRTGRRYGKGAGLRVLAEGREIAASEKLARVTGNLPPASAMPAAKPPAPTAAGQTSAGWIKSPANPVLGGALGTCFDIAVLKEGDTFRMWFSWRPKKSIAITESKDGVHWGEPVIVLGPNKETDWEADINRPAILRRDGGYHIWYTGQAGGQSRIGYATSTDGKTWTRRSAKPVLSPEQPWEKAALMCPHVIWDEQSRRFRMWYSGGEQYEPDAIGYATSPDGLAWTRHAANPVFRPDPAIAWEKHKVTACQVVRQGEWHLMFYIGFRDRDHAQIGLARSRDGVTGWQRHPANPIIRPGENQWDADACYKPFAIRDGGRWSLWYNGRRGSAEQIGLAIHEGEDLGF